MLQTADILQFKAPKGNFGAFFVCNHVVLLAKRSNL